MRTFSCVCGQTLFFENVACEACGREVGWCPSCRAIAALEPLGDGTYRMRQWDLRRGRWSNARTTRMENVCNRCLPAADAVNGGLCDACRFNRTIPDLSIRRQPRALGGAGGGQAPPALHARFSRRCPTAARRTGSRRRSPSTSRRTSIPQEGFWRWMGQGERVYTGHADGKITINIREADSVEREKLRVDLGRGAPHADRAFPPRDRPLLSGICWCAGGTKTTSRRLFGDHENPPYQEAMARHYRDGAAAGLEGPLRQRLRHHASMGGLGGDLRALSGHHRAWSTPPSIWG